MYFSHRENFYKYPGRLTWLCAEALGKFVSSIMMKLVVQKQQHLLEEICEHVHDMLHSSLPESIVDEMTVRILHEFENAYMELSKVYGSEDDCEEIATEIFIAILGPSVTRIECVEYTCHPEFLDGYKMRYSDLVYSAITKLKNVRVLRIGDARYLNKRYELGDCYDYKITDTLEEFSSGLTTNQEVQTLSEQCKKLRVLDVGDSLDVYEESIPYILKLECLEELDVHYTSILYTEYFPDLLNGLTNTHHSDGKSSSEHLKIFVCDGLEQEHVGIVGNKFPNLTSLKLIQVECDLSLLKTLKCLKNLDVGLKTYKQLKELLSCIGKQLVCLKLRDIVDIPFDHLASTCTSLNCLHLESNATITRNLTVSECQKLCVPDFPQIIRLELKCYDSCFFTKYMMSKFKNVRKLYLSNCNDDDIFNCVFKRNYMKHLEGAIFKEFCKEYIALQFYEDYAVIADFTGHSVPLHSYPL